MCCTLGLTSETKLANYINTQRRQDKTPIFNCLETCCCALFASSVYINCKNVRVSKIPSLHVVCEPKIDFNSIYVNENFTSKKKKTKISKHSIYEMNRYFGVWNTWLVIWFIQRPFMLNCLENSFKIQINEIYRMSEYRILTKHIEWSYVWI